MPMGYDVVAMLAVLIFAAAILYATVGHAGASAYLAVMTLFGIPPTVMKPTALALNILVAALATWKFRQTGCFRWRLFWPFASTSVPAAFIGGLLQLPGTYYKPLLGLVLLYAAQRLIWGPSLRSSLPPKSLPLLPALAAGVGMGLLSGLTGVGGGIFLSPLLLFAGWAEPRETSGTAAPFILVNSIAGLLGHVTSVWQIPAAASWWCVAALAGGWIGAEVGSRRLNTTWLRRLLGVLLVIAGLKLLLSPIST